MMGALVVPLVVPREQTPINMISVTGRLGAMFYDLWGRLPSERLLRIASGIIGVENAGGWAIWNGNVGNVTAPTGYAGRVWEANGLQFLDFGTELGSIENGMRYWWTLMAARYHDVLVDADQGDESTAIRDLFRLGYVGADWTRKQLADYTRGVSKYAAEYAWAADKVANQFRKPWVGAAIGGSALLAVSAGGYYWHRQRRAA
jgi:hypothetical protein